MKKIILIQILLLTTIIYSQSLVGKKYIAYLGNKCGDTSSAFLYTELNFEKDKVIVLYFSTRGFGDFDNKLSSNSKKYDYKIKKKILTILNSNYGKFEIQNNKLITNQIVFNLIIQNKISKINYNAKGGGKDGSYVNLEITKDSIVCNNGANYPSYNYAYYEKTKEDLWKKLNENFDLNEFKKIKSQKSLLYIDEYDEEIKIEIDGKYYTILNAITFGQINKNILDFINLLRNQSRRFEEESLIKIKN
jgi:hypothetical protein